MDALPRHPALSPGASWPTLRMWVRRKGEHAVLVTLAPARGAGPEEVLLPCDAALLILLFGGSPSAAAGPPGTPRAWTKKTPTGGWCCARGAHPARSGSAARSPGGRRLVRADAGGDADGRSAAAGVGAGDEAAHGGTPARQLLLAKRSARRGRSVRAVSGGLPTLGKRG